MLAAQKEKKARESIQKEINAISSSGKSAESNTNKIYRSS